MEQKDIIFNYNNIDYVLINEFNFNNKHLYFFGAMDDVIFCEKNNEEFIPVSKEENKEIRELFGLVKSDLLFEIMSVFDLYNLLFNKTALYNYDELYLDLLCAIRIGGILRNRSLNTYKPYKKVEKEIVEHNIKNTIDLIEKLVEKENICVDVNEIEKRAYSEGRYLYFDPDGLIEGFYNEYNNIIGISNQLKDGHDIEKVFTHELIHKISDQNKALKRTNFKTFDKANYKFKKTRELSEIGLTEGMTENLNNALYNENAINVMRAVCKDKVKECTFDFSPKTAYLYRVSLVQQMEYLLEEKSYKSILEKDVDFKSKFISKYGYPLYIKVAYGANLLNRFPTKIEQKVNNVIFKNKDIRGMFATAEMNFFDKIQNTLMREAFDIELKQVDNADDAKKFLEKLKRFEIYRGIISSHEIDKQKNIVNKKANQDFKNYYNECYSAVYKKLVDKGYSEEVAEHFIGNLKYDDTYISKYTIYKYKKDISRTLLDLATRFVVENEDTVLSDLGTYIAIDKQNGNAIGVVTEKGRITYLYNYELRRRIESRELKRIEDIRKENNSDERPTLDLFDDTYELMKIDVKFTKENMKPRIERYKRRLEENRKALEDNKNNKGESIEK